MRPNSFDQTLIDIEIEKAAKAYDLIEPFDLRKLRGASYDLSVGAKAVIATPNGLDWISLDEQKILVLPPSRTCVIYSLEKVNMPANMKGRLSLRSHYAMQRLEYNGGVIDPGYKGHLFFTLANLGDVTLELNFEDALVTAEFTLLHKDAQRLYNDGWEILKLDDRQQPPKLPPLPKEQYDPIELSGRVQKLEEKFRKIESDLNRFEPSLQVTEDIVQSLILASVAGVVAGMFLFVVPNLNKSPSLYVILGGSIIVIGAVLAIQNRRNKRK